MTFVLTLLREANVSKSTSPPKPYNPANGVLRKNAGSFSTKEPHTLTCSQAVTDSDSLDQSSP